MTARSAHPGTDPVLEIADLSVNRGGRTLWQGLSLDLHPGEFLAVLGPNGAGKSSLVTAILGALPPHRGRIQADGLAPGARQAKVGYVPQSQPLAPGLTLRGRDFVALGVDGHRFGPGGPRAHRLRREKAIHALAEVDGTYLSEVPVGAMSGGQQQRLRVAQALAGDPRLILCDEPLLSLDLAGQRAVAAALHKRRREQGTAVVFVTHEINPILPLVDRVLYLAGGKFRLGSPDEVFSSASLSELYGTPVEVLRVHGQIVVVGENHQLTGLTEPTDDYEQRSGGYERPGQRPDRTHARQRPDRTISGRGNS